MVVPPFMSGWVAEASFFASWVALSIPRKSVMPASVVRAFSSPAVTASRGRHDGNEQVRKVPAVRIKVAGATSADCDRKPRPNKVVLVK